MKNFLILLIVQIVFTTHFAFPQGDWKMKGNKESLRDKIIFDVAEDGFGNIWFITSPQHNKYWGYLNQYTTSGEWIDFKSNKEIYKTKFYSLNPGDSGNMICRAKGFKNYEYDGSSWTILPHKAELNIYDTYNISEFETISKYTLDSLGRIWVETNKGLLLCENDSFVRYFEKTGFKFSDGFVITGEAIFQFIDNEFVKIRDINKKEDYHFGGIDHNNRGWFAKRYKFETNSICYYHNNSWKDFEFEPEFNKNAVPNINFQPNGTVWIYSSGYIMYVKNDGKLTKLIENDKKQPFSVAKVLPDYNNIYFFLDGKYEAGSLIHYDGERIYDYRDNSELLKLQDSYITDAMFDSKDNLWITAGIKGFAGNHLKGNLGIIIKKSGDSFESFDKSNGFVTESFSNIFEDNQGRIWILTYDDGVFVYEYDD